MALFRPYNRDEAKADGPQKASDLVGKPGATKAPRPSTSEPTPAVSEPAPQPQAGPAKKDRPTPKRSQAQAERMQRLHPTLTPKEEKRLARRNQRLAEAKRMEAFESRPERVLMRNFIDNSWHVGEFLMPVMILLLAGVFLTQLLPQLTYPIMALMYGVLIIVVIDCIVTWFRFKKVLRERIPGASTRGLLLPALNRLIQIRRFRVPAPVIRRGEGY